MIRLLCQLLFLWSAVALLLGWFGANWIHRIWSTQVEQSFVQSASAAVAIVEARQWQEPVESSEAWQALESHLDVGLVPIGSPATSAAMATSAASVPESDSESKQDPAPSSVDDSAPTLPFEPAIEWSAVAGESSRMSAVYPIQSPTISASKLRVTRQIEPSKLGAAWWMSWAALNLVACLLSAIGFWALHRKERTQKFMLRPWFVALKEGGSKSQLLPPVEAIDHDFSLQMDSVADSVNHVYANLCNTNERSELVLGNLREGVLAIDDRSRILLVNRALRKLLSISDNNLLYRPLVEVIRTPKILKLVRSLLDEQVAVEETFEHGDAPRHLRLLGRPLPLGEDRVGALLTVRDETMMIRAEMIKKEFVSNAGHELKTPLAAIRGYAETLQLGAIDDRKAAEGFISSIITQADRLDHLVKGMLQLSKVEEGVSIQYQRFDAIGAVSPCIEAARGLSQSKGVEIELRTSDEKLPLHSDRDAFQTIVSNLLSNAVRYTDSGGRVIVNLEQDDSQLRLEVKDTGIGIKAEDLDRVFERFYRAEKDRSTATGGTGLGLSMVKHLAAALGGNVTVESQFGEGSVFQVVLPNEPDFSQMND